MVAKHTNILLGPNVEKGRQMKINCRLGHVYQDCDERLDTLDIYLEEGERIAVGEVLDIPMMDGSTIQREVKALNPQSAGDFAPISDAIARGVAEGRNHVSISPVNTMCASLRNLSTSSCRALGTSSQERISPYARSWFETVESNYGDETHANFLPQDAGNTTLDNF